MIPVNHWKNLELSLKLDNWRIVSENPLQFSADCMSALKSKLALFVSVILLFSLFGIKKYLFLLTSVNRFK